MLYLPRPLSFKEVPEARDLIPVMEDGKQSGDDYRKRDRRRILSR